MTTDEKILALKKELLELLWKLWHAQNKLIDSYASENEYLKNNRAK